MIRPPHRAVISGGNQMSVEMSPMSARFGGRAPLLLSCLAGMAAPVASYAQEQTETPLEEVVVTAQLREQNIQDVPIAITALSADQLESAGVTDLADISRLAPDFTAVR